jgi:hypothetical protein
MRLIRLALPVAAAASLWLATPAAAVPECSDLTPTTNICQTPGHARITTSPNPAFTNPFPGWGFGNLGYGVGGGGVWIGI